MKTLKNCLILKTWISATTIETLKSNRFTSHEVPSTLMICKTTKTSVLKVQRNLKFVYHVQIKKDKN
jgi:hypothetical protein